MQKTDHSVLIYIKLILTAAFWGGTFIAGKFIAKNVGPFSAAFLRFTLASFCLLLLTLKTESKLPPLKKNLLLPILLLGMTGIFAYNVFFFKALHTIQASRASVIIATCPVFIAFFSSLLFRESLTPTKIFGIIISVTGAVTVISKGKISQYGTSDELIKDESGLYFQLVELQQKLLTATEEEKQEALKKYDLVA